MTTMGFKPDLLHFKFDFNDVVDLRYEDGYTICSEDQIDCNQNEWVVSLSRGKCVGDEVWADLHIHHCSNPTDELGFKFTMLVKNTQGETLEEKSYQFFLWEKYASDFLNLSSIFDSVTVRDNGENFLKDEDLCIDIFIQTRLGTNAKLVREQRLKHKTICTLQNKMLELMGNKDKADILTKVGGEEFYLHSLILENNASLLADYCKQNDIINDMDPNVFQMILKHVYSEYLPSDNEALAYGKELITVGKELIDAANRFELVELKDAVEHILVRERILDRRNAADYLVFADAQSCTLLKQYAISVFLLFAKDILKSDDSKSLRESGELLSEIIMMMVDQGYRVGGDIAS